MAKKPADSSANPQPRKPILVAVASEYDRRYIQPGTEHFSFTGMELRPQGGRKRTATAAARPDRKTVNEITLVAKPRLVNFVQNPYYDTDLQRFEACMRRNWAVKSGMAVRALFTFGKGSELVIELMGEDAKLETKEEIQAKVDSNPQWKAAVDNIAKLDEKLKINEVAETFYWQGVGFGRALVLKIYSKDGSKLERLMPINTRRLGNVVLDRENDMSYEGVVIDGSDGVMKEYLIYAGYNPRQISPHTEHYGYSALESIDYIAQALNVAGEEDVPEILKTAWLASVILSINTAGLSETEARSKIGALIDAIKAGKYIGFNEAVLDYKQLDLKPDFAGLVQIIDKMESIIFKTLQVPQFLVQNEGVANRATAIASATQFLNGVIANDQAWISQVFEEQHYDPLLRAELGLAEGEELPFRVKRVWNQAKVAEFVDLADAIRTLIDGHVWDIQKANEVLDTPEVTARVKAEQERNRQLALTNNGLKGDAQNNGNNGTEAAQSGKPDTGAGDDGLSGNNDDNAGNNSRKATGAVQARLDNPAGDLDSIRATAGIKADSAKDRSEGSSGNKRLGRYAVKSGNRTFRVE